MAKITLFNGSPVSANTELNPGMAASYGRSVEGITDAVSSSAKNVASYVASNGTPAAKVLGLLADGLGDLQDQALDKSAAVNQKLGAFNKIREADQQIVQGTNDLSGAEGATGGKAVNRLREKYVKTTNDVADKVAQGVDDPNAKAELMNEFQKYQKVGAQNFTEKVRGIALSEQESSLYKNLDELSKSATINGPGGLQQAHQMLSSSLQQATASGLINADKAESLQAQIAKRIINTLNDNAISKDPQQVINDIKDGNYNYLSDADKLGLYNKANTIRTDIISKARIQDDITGAADRDRISALQTQLQLGIQDGSVDRTTLMKYEEQLGEKGFNAMNSLVQKKIFEDAAKANDRLKLSDRVANGDDLTDVPTNDINEHFKQAVVGAKQEASAKGTQISDLGLEATVAARYNAPVPAFTKKLEHAALRGTPEQQADAYGAYKILGSLGKDDVMSSMPDKIQSRFSEADRYMNTLGFTAAQAFAEIDKREETLKDPVVRKQVNQAWEQSSLNPKSSEYNIESVINSDLFETGTFESNPSIDYEVSRNLGALLEDSFKATGNSDSAIASLKPFVKKNIGISNIGGTKRLMLYPPSKFKYNEANVQRTMIKELTGNTQPLEGGQSLGSAYLKAGPETVKAIQRGDKDPPYEVRYMLNGMETFVLDKNGDPVMMTLEGAR